MSADLDHCQNRRNCQKIQIEAMSLDAEACSAREGRSLCCGVRLLIFGDFWQFWHFWQSSICVHLRRSAANSSASRLFAPVILPAPHQTTGAKSLEAEEL